MCCRGSPRARWLLRLVISAVRLVRESEGGKVEGRRRSRRRMGGEGWFRGWGGQGLFQEKAENTGEVDEVDTYMPNSSSSARCCVCVCVCARACASLSLSLLQYTELLLQRPLCVCVCVCVRVCVCVCARARERERERARALSLSQGRCQPTGRCAYRPSVTL
jgi:hypothetical protein